MELIQVIFAIGVHITFLFSIFDIYFKSPIVKGVEPFKPLHDALADRLVLFVVDGLRAESFIDHTTMPYLRSIAKDRGRWGISNTRVPTESRPGHVAIIAGFYEDPSAITKGWKENPVDFDSVLNQSRHSWCWGAYDILEIFTKSNDDHVFASKMYPYDQTFSTDKNTTHLDEWVFSNVKEYLNNAKYNISLRKKLLEDKTIFFLHLLGTDTSGHTHKPNNPNYLTTLRYVDEGIKNMVAFIEDYFDHDQKTTFLVTSDHGMTDWGSHGSGDVHETETPYVIWGSGVKLLPTEPTEPNSLTKNASTIVAQADMTPLMATILSIPVPVNSVGQLPHELLDMSHENRAKAIYSNCRQLAAQYDKKRNDVEENLLPFLDISYKPLDRETFDIMMTKLNNSLENKEYDALISLCNDMMKLSLEGLEYYHKYYQIPLLVLITLSFIGWIFYLLTKLILYKVLTNRHYVRKLRHKDELVFTNKHGIALSIGLFLCLIVSLQSLPIQYNVYCLLPACLWGRLTDFVHLWSNLYCMAKRRLRRIAFEALMILCGVVALSFSFTYRWTLSIPLTAMAIWPWFPNTRRQLSTLCITVWSTTCFMLSIFTFLPVVGKKTNVDLVMAAGYIGILLLLVYMYQILIRLLVRNKASKLDVYYNIFQIILMGVAIYNVFAQSKRFELGTPVSDFDQMVAWVLAGLSLILPMFSKKRMMCRLAAIYMSTLTSYILLSVAHEALFLVTLIVNLSCWAYIEQLLKRYPRFHFADFEFSSDVVDNPTFIDQEELLRSNDYILLRQDFRRGFYFLVYIIVSFFGTGNIASLNSFEVRWVTCFITSYKPFVITGLILWKTLMPFICVASGFQAVHTIVQAPAAYLNTIVLIFSNIMGIILLFQVKNTGSWLEIGTSISQFVIIQIITLFIVFIQMIAKVLTHVDLKVLFSKKPKEAFKDM